MFPHTQQTGRLARLGLEALEDRTALSTTSVIDLGSLSSTATVASTSTVTTGAPRVVSGTVMGPSSAVMTSIRVTFDRVMQLSTFSPADVTLTGPTGKVIAAQNVKAAEGPAGRGFDLVFGVQTAAGTYTLKVGPNVKDLAGANMTAFTGTYKLPTTTPTPSPTPAAIVAGEAKGPNSTQMTSIRVTFNREMDFTTFTPADVTLTGPGGRAITATNIKEVAGSAGRGFDVVFGIQTVAGTYTLKVGPNVKDTTGVNMTAYTGTYKLPLTTPPAPAAPKVKETAASGVTANTIDKVRVTFEKAIQLSSFTSADVTLTGPNGTIAISSVKVVSGSGDRSFDIAFASQNRVGTYTLKVGPNVKDLAGTNMAARFEGTYQIRAASNGTYKSEAAVTILPSGRAVAIINVADSVRIADLNVTLNITHPRLGDLYIHLQGPDGTDIQLSRTMGGDTANMTNVTIDDEATNHIATIRGPAKDLKFQPLQPLDIMDGKLATGMWKLWVEDRGGVHRGTVDSWALNITPAR